MVFPKIAFFPYIGANLRNKHKIALLDAKYVVDYFPYLNKDLFSSNIERLGYISFYKAPFISQTEYATGFNGGAPTREELENNVFWRTADLDKKSLMLVIENNSFLLPLGKQKYKKGWYKSTISNNESVDKLLFSIEKMLDYGLKGIFVDNVVDTAQNIILGRLYNLLKNKNKTLILNVGRTNLNDANIPADAYVTENFLFGNSTTNNRLYFAGKYLNELCESGLLENINKVLHLSKQKNIEIIGYTKTSKDLCFEERTKRLLFSKSIAKKIDISWTSSLNEIKMLSNYT